MTQDIPQAAIEAAKTAIREVKKSSLCSICDRFVSSGPRAQVACHCLYEAQAAITAALPHITAPVFTFDSDAEQAARADERRKTLDECAAWIDRRIAQGDVGGPRGMMMADLELGVAAAHFRALAGKKDGP